MGSGVSEYGGEAPILSEPRGRFAYFAATGKVGRRPQAAKFPCERWKVAAARRVVAPYTKNRSMIAPHKTLK